MGSYNQPKDAAADSLKMVDSIRVADSTAAAMAASDTTKKDSTMMAIDTTKKYFFL